ncbi:hypothetical protein [Mycolicibacterium aubagnense]|uniref:Uncharacterized protein n=1 Tax=Mycolicibacterium aubagnense TaxID=319707 RepID=A0ABM7IAR3_9MYCO|nr:hypothetical protein [Mycolicibacterium aubagnense]TLH58471.1 hypothetical protein C1S80_19790 [Mycolicibacterium aubagnense]WGI34412.1 hypothetical protein QDT91_08765 [Mycolicibacterium aubagnense]BBX83731.1 hypothetical protein MAUB_16040 [Mycolicibacterium aubagnense]
MEYSFDPPVRSSDDWRPNLIGGYFADQGWCGRSLNGGLLRFHDAMSAQIGQELVDAMFRTRGIVTEVFAFDWLARQYAVTSRLTPEGMPDRTESARTVVVLDAFDGSVTPWVDVHRFEQALGTTMAQDFLLPNLFQEWLAKVAIDRLEFDWCAGANVPAFYGGKRELSNLNHDSIEVYLYFTRQLWDYGNEHGPGSPPPHVRRANA